MTLQELIETNREALVRAGIRGIDLDYLLDTRVPHQHVVEPLRQVIAIQLARWLEVRGKVTEAQWTYYEASEPGILEMRTLRKAARDLKKAFEQTCLVFFKEAEKRDIEAKKKAKRSEADDVDAMIQDLQS